MGPIFLRLAYRNLRRNGRRTFLTVMSVAFGLMMVVWTQALLAGRNRNMIDTAVSTKTANVQIQRSDYAIEHQVEQSFPTLPLSLESEIPSDARFARRVYLPSLISNGTYSSNVLLTGVEPSAERRLTRILSSKVSGNDLEDDLDAKCPSRQIFIGYPLAQILKAKPGSRLVLMAQAADGTLGDDLFLVKGIFDSGSPDLDKAIAFTPLACAQKLGTISGTHEIAIRVDDDTVSPTLATTLGNRLGKSYKVTTWKEALPALASILRLNDATVAMLSLILLVVISMGMINSILVSILERQQEFGVMLALGVTPRQLIQTIFWEGTLIGISGGILGLILSSLIIWYNIVNGFDLRFFYGNQTVLGQFKLSLIIYPVFSWKFALLAFVVSCVLVSMVCLVPTSRISRLKPMDVLRK